MKIQEIEEYAEKYDKLIFRFLECYFNNHQIIYKPEEKNKGCDVFLKKIERYRDDNIKKVKYLKKKYKKIYPSDDYFFLDVYRSNESKIYKWENYVLHVLHKNPNFRKIFFERIKPYDNPDKDLFYKENFYWFYNLHVNIISCNPYKDIDDVIDLLKIWKAYFFLDFQLKWIDKKISKIENVINANLSSAKMNFEGKTLKFFLDELVYNALIERLEMDGLIDNNFKLIHPENSRWSDLRAASCIGWLLKERQFLTLNQKELVLILSQTFSVELSEGTYSAAKKTFAKSLDKDEPHLVNYSFINTL